MGARTADAAVGAPATAPAASRTLLTYECRTFVTDPESRHKFLRYWTLIRPFVGHIMGATVRTVRAQAEMEANP